MLPLLLGAIPAMICLGAGLAGWKIRQRRTDLQQKNLDVNWLNSLSWQDFEKQMAEVFRERGYRVEEVGGGGADGGVDLRLRREGETSIVQCKRWKTSKVGVKLVRELFGVMTAEKADRAIFITSGFYTEEARDFAESQPIELVDGTQLAKMMRRFQTALKPAPAPAPAPTPAPTPSNPHPRLRRTRNQRQRPIHQLQLPHE